MSGRPRTAPLYATLAAALAACAVVLPGCVIGPGTKAADSPGGPTNLPCASRGPVNSVAFSADGALLAAGSGELHAEGEPLPEPEARIRLFDVVPGTLLATPRAALDARHGQVFALAFSPDAQTLASTGTDATVDLWDTARAHDATPPRSFAGHVGWVRAIQISPDGTKVASGGQDHTVRIRETGSGREIATLEGHTRWVTCLAFSRDGRKLVSGSDDRTVRLWSLESGKLLKQATADGAWGVFAVAFSPDGETIAAAGADGAIHLLDAFSLIEISVLYGHAGNVSSLVYAQDGTLISGGGDGTIRLWDAVKGVEVRQIKDGDRITGLALSPDGHTLAAASADGSVHLRDLRLPPTPR